MNSLFFCPFGIPKCLPSQIQFFLNLIAEQSEPDLPIADIADPYTKERPKCVLCPRRYDSSVTIRPSWKNPKLLAQV